jgi:hypothetical protein
MEIKIKMDYYTPFFLNTAKCIYSLERYNGSFLFLRYLWRSLGNGHDLPPKN